MLVQFPSGKTVPVSVASQVTNWCGRQGHQHSGVHQLEGKELFVSPLPLPSPSTIYLKNIPQWVELDRLKDYLEARSKLDVNEISFREDNTGAIVTFTSNINGILNSIY